jgi:hypothetical protein
MWNIYVNRSKTKVVEFMNPHSKRGGLGKRTYLFEDIPIEVVDCYTYTLGLSSITQGIYPFHLQTFVTKLEKLFLSSNSSL